MVFFQWTTVTVEMDGGGLWLLTPLFHCICMNTLEG